MVVEYPPSRVVNICDGPIIGRRLIFEGPHQVDAYQGIPFAQPPLGELRFKKPQKPTPWTEVKKTVSFPDRSIQVSSRPNPDMPPMSENCLQLNVFCPVWDAHEAGFPNGFPVFFYVHGGGFVSESTAKYGDIGICENLVKKNIVVVNVQYRVGMLGFFSTGDDVCPGNNGLWDLKMSLEWTRDNIGFFHGDKNNITIGGQSAGSALTQYLAISPHTRDLFHKFIGMAGFPNEFCEWSSAKNAADKCRDFAKKLGVDGFYNSEMLIEKLRQVPAEEFALGIPALEDGLPIGPRYDGYFFPRPFTKLYEEAPAKPAILGCADCEGMQMGVKDAGKMERIELLLTKLIPEVKYGLKTMAVRRGYLKLLLDLDSTYSELEYAELSTDVYGDVFMNCGLMKAALTWLEKCPDIYMYSFKHYNENMFGPMKAAIPFLRAIHCAELPYVFAISVFFPYEFNEDDKKVLYETTSRYTNFIKYGNPNGVDQSPPGGVHWLPITEEHPQRHLVVLKQAHMEEVYKNGRSLYIVRNT